MAKPKTNLVVKSNYLVEASYKLSLNAQRLTLFAISKLRSRAPMKGQKVQRIEALEFAKMFGINPKNAYSTLKTACDDLYEADIKTYDHKGMDRFRWCERVRFENAGYIDLYFTDSIAPYLTKIYGEFTKYELSSLSDVKSVYSIRLFELLKKHKYKHDKNSGERWITIEDFKKWFEVGDKYPRYYDLKRRVIMPAIKELEEKANLTISWEEIREKRQVVKLEFMYEENSQLMLDFK